MPARIVFLAIFLPDTIQLFKLESKTGIAHCSSFDGFARAG
jgi:hypothetical protein